jgi:hypothetical protein
VLTALSEGHAWIAGRVLLEIQPGGKTDFSHFNTPTPAAVYVLKGLCVEGGGPVLRSFLEAGGVAAAVGLLGESSCPEALQCAGHLIEKLVDRKTSPCAGARQLAELADRLFRSGGWGHMVQLAES